MTSQPQTLWTEPTRDTEAEAALMRDLPAPHNKALTARLLVNRGLSDPAAAYAFLFPELNHLHNPFLLPDMDKAARRIADAIQKKETIFVHGDYDVDGVTSTALYVHTLRGLKASLVFRVPHRKKDGYDIKAAAVDWAREQGASVVITSDCGIQAHEAIGHANRLGMTVIVTDHHEPGPTLPDAYAVVNPHRHDSTYPFPNLAGVGVAFKTMQAVMRLLRPEKEASFIRWALDLVACGTVADVMPLQGENRVFARFGLRELARSRKVGLRMLLEGAGWGDGKTLTTETISFGLAPRINAVGRVDDAAVALDLLLTGDPEEAGRIVADLNTFNLERQTTQKRILEEAQSLLAERDLEDIKVLVIASSGWNAGVVGIVAGKLAELYSRPTIVIGVNDAETHGKGSARSIPGFDMFRGIQICKDLLESCGGHEMAAGLSLKMDNFTAFEMLINAHAGEVMTPEDYIPRLAHDGVVDPSQITLSQLDEWADFAPFGEANPEPRFASEDLVICEAKRIGKDMSHLKMRVRANALDPTDCVAWGQGHWTDRVGPGDRLHAVFAPQINEWNGRRSVQFLIKDLRQG